MRTPDAQAVTDSWKRRGWIPTDPPLFYQGWRVWQNNDIRRYGYLPHITSKRMEVIPSEWEEAITTVQK